MGLNILLASDHYPPFIGGAHRQTQLLAHQLHQRGHRVSVATVWHGGLLAEEDDDGVPVYRFKQLRTVLPALVRDKLQRHQPPFPDPVTVIGLRKIIERLRPDVIHSYGWFTYSLAAALWGTNIPLLISARDYGYTCANRTLLYEEGACSGPALLKCVQCSGHYYGAPKGWLAAVGVRASQPLVRRKVRGLHSISTYVQQVMLRDFWGGGEAAASVLQSIIPSFREDDEGDDANSVGLEPYLRQLPGEPYILFVGALRQVKGVPQLLAAYEQLQTRVPLVLIGTFERDTPRAFPPGVRVLQDFPHPAVMAAWDRSLFGVVPSLWPEPLGSVVYEGMSRGKAMIGTTPGGHTDMIVDQETGFLVPPGDVEALTHAMRHLLDEAGLRESFGQAGRELAQQFTARQVVPQFERLYYSIISGKQQSINETSTAKLGN